jgi:chemotaxis protein methyltransferase CheR
MDAPLDEVEAMEAKLLLEGIFQRYGYDLRGYSPESMTRRLSALVSRSGCAHMAELMHRMLTSREFFRAALHELTVQVSELFRDPEVYRTLRERVLPMLRTYPVVKIWHAGCSAGEEAYSSAILLLEENLYDRAQIYATDMSPGAIELAREGVYPESVGATFAQNYASFGGKGQAADYFTRGYGRIAMREALKRNIMFFEHTLGSDQAFGEMNVIFCRNVLIYFGEAWRQKVMPTFLSSLTRGGFLCLGTSERIVQGYADSFSEFAATERIYRLRGRR